MKPEFYQPYRDPSANFLYNLLFCDDLSLFLNHHTPEPGTPMQLIKDATDLNAIAQLTTSVAEESRIRALAYNLLREKGWQIPPKILLGVIFEVPLQQGLDTLAAYADHRIRYLNQSGKVLIMETAPANIAAKTDEVLAAAQTIVNQIGPWDKARLPPPTAKQADIRMTFLVSDGLYFGQGGFANLQRDPMAAPLIHHSGQLLQLVVDAGLSHQA